MVEYDGSYQEMSTSILSNCRIQNYGTNENYISLKGEDLVLTYI